MGQEGVCHPLRSGTEKEKTGKFSGYQAAVSGCEKRGARSRQELVGWRTEMQQDMRETVEKTRLGRFPMRGPGQFSLVLSFPT